MILKLSKTKRLSFYRKTEIYIGEKDFDKIQVLIPSEVDENDTSELTFKLHLVNERGEYAIRTLTVEQEGTKVVGSTSITADLTSVAQDFSVYIEMVKSNDTIIGKTNVLEIRVNPLPDEQGEIIPEEIEKRGVIIAQTNPPDSSHKKYRLGALWINYADETQYVLTDIDESQAPQEYGYVWNKVSNQTVISSDSAPEYTPNNMDYKYSMGDVWVQTDSNAEKIVAISVCTGNTKVTIDAQNWKYNYTWAVLTSGSNNYTDLTNKPSINNVTLSGNKSSDDLNLQDKLTAGQNITIDEDNVISAEGGGVTSYNGLTDKPYVTINDDSGAFSSWAITDEIYFATGEFFGTHIVDGEINISLDSSVSRYHNERISYNFNRFSSAPYNGCLKLQHSFVSNFPSALNRIDTSKPYFLTQHFNTSELGKRERYAFRKVSGYSRDGDFIEYAQICYINYHSYLDNEIISQTDWVELTGGGSQIVSGVVNANGTITFTDSDGNTFTTSGSSVIGSDGFSPVATVTQTASGATVSITDSTGTTTANISNGQDGNDYVLTAQDKSDIADIVLSELPTTQGVLYGNTSN